MRLSLEAKPRDPMTKGQVRRLRNEGYALLSISEAGEETQHFMVNEKAVKEVLHRGGPAALIEVKADKSGARLTMPRQIQRDPVTHRILNIGLIGISARKPITAPVNVVLHGEPAPVREGIGVLDQEHQTVEVRALPDQLPTQITVDVSGLELHGKVHISDLPITGDYEIVTPADTIIAVVHTVRAAIIEEPIVGEVAATDEEKKAEAESGKEGDSDS